MEPVPWVLVTSVEPRYYDDGGREGGREEGREGEWRERESNAINREHMTPPKQTKQCTNGGLSTLQSRVGNIHVYHKQVSSSHTETFSIIKQQYISNNNIDIRRKGDVCNLDHTFLGFIWINTRSDTQYSLGHRLRDYCIPLSIFSDKVLG